MIHVCTHKQGVLSLVGDTRRVIVQGVYELFEKERSTEWQQEPRINRLVFIGITNILHTLLNPSLYLQLLCISQVSHCAILLEVGALGV